jgi:dihydroflavonol-4-reductase
MKAFVTGSTGMVGSNLVRLLLEQGHEVVALARTPSKAAKQLGESPRLCVVKGDMEDVNAFAQHLQGSDVLFHTAAYFRDYFGSGDHWPMLEKINVAGTIDLLNRAEQAGVKKAIYVSSSGVLDARREGIIDENGPAGEMQERNLYFKSKVLAEQKLLEWLKTHSLPVVQILPGWIWGPGDAAPTAAGQLVLDYLNGKLPGIIEGRSNIVDARDVSQAMIYAVEKGRSGERYLISNTPATIEALLHGLQKVSGLPAPTMRISYRMALLVAYASEFAARLRSKDTLITVEGIRTLQDRGTFSAEKAKRELGATFHPLGVTLRDTVMWYRAQQPEKITRPQVVKTVVASAR